MIKVTENLQQMISSQLKASQIFKKEDLKSVTTLN